MDLQPGQSLHGFTVASTQKVAEIDGEAALLKHVKSGARLLLLLSDDANKAFSISFKTPPADDTGVFHILEHSVLCGSSRFPVKEPFVNLLKTSMQTFLNALTFSDKTMYPVASTNEQDLLNLMDVYLDAVLHPAIYSKRTIFEQEGWHYELDRSQDESAPQLRFNGVVYNEMKGALSDASSVLYDTVQANLFPDNAYRFESGGDPASIPTLTYEGYLDEHRRHYRLDNSYLTLYGNVDADRMLAFLDERYLSPVADEQAADRKQRQEAGDVGALEARTIEPQEPVCRLGVVRAMDTAPENACMALGFVIGPSGQRRRIMAVDVLLDALMGSNEAPLKRALLDADLADEAAGSLAEATLQPFAMIELKGLRDGAAERFRTVARTELERLAAGGLDHGLVEASLSRYEFVMREREFGMADGVALAINALSGWLYDDNAPLDYIRYEDDFAFLREALEGDYFETLIRDVFLDNPHQTEVEVRPEAAQGASDEQMRLDAIQATLDEADLKRIDEEVERLRSMQTEPDSPEALATLPQLARADIQQAPAEPAYRLDPQAPLPCLRHSVPTHGIAYAYRYFDANRLSFDDIPYLSILCSVLGKLGTARRSASELDTLVNGRLGNLSFFPDLYQDEHDPDKLDLKVAVSASALSKNVGTLATLPCEVMRETNFSDAAKIKDILMQRRVSMEQGFAQAGHSAAMARLGSYCSRAGVVAEQLRGIDFYRFLKDLLAHFDERAPELAARLQRLAEALFAQKSQTISFAGSDADYHAFWEANPSLCAQGGQAGLARAQLAVPQPVVRNEAFIVPTDVSYTATGFDRRQLDAAAPYAPAWQVGARVLTYDYLWNEVRVRGGAYGVGFQTTRIGNLRFYSYRDPHVDETLQRFEAAAGWLRNAQLSDSDLDGYVVSTVAGFDSPQKARALIRRQASSFFSGRTPEDRLRTRSGMLNANRGDLDALADVVEAACSKGARCTFGNKDILRGAHADFDVVDLLGA